ncbi:MAG: ABC transporter ATP-binding protein, partial [Actinomycetia bacterium]|nr:ABC transporter ATP-binding protein [Actinomycetes bacterium]
GVLWIRRLMRELAADGCTVFFSSHLMSEMALVADHLIILERGRKLADATLAQLMADHAERHVVARVRDDAERRTLVAALRHASGQIGIEQAGSELTIRNADADVVGRCAARAGITLSQLTSHSTSLEDVFMAMTAGHAAQQEDAA